jgi:hypothetical protein
VLHQPLGVADRRAVVALQPEHVDEPLEDVAEALA